jgi:DNA-binding NarL/FixJ family response regulator
MGTETISLGIVDDHTIFRKALSNFVNGFENCIVTLDAANGKELQQELKKTSAPEILLLDLRMKEMDGLETAKWLYNHYPQIRMIVDSARLFHPHSVFYFHPYSGGSFHSFVRWS